MRFRVIVDIIDPNDHLGTTQMDGIAQEIGEKAQLAPTPEQKRNGVVASLITQKESRRTWHIHNSPEGSYCTPCDHQSRDELA